MADEQCFDVLLLMDDEGWAAAVHCKVSAGLVMMGYGCWCSRCIVYDAAFLAPMYAVSFMLCMMDGVWWVRTELVFLTVVDMETGRSMMHVLRCTMGGGQCTMNDRWPVMDYG